VGGGDSHGAGPYAGPTVSPYYGFSVKVLGQRANPGAALWSSLSRPGGRQVMFRTGVTAAGGGVDFRLWHTGCPTAAGASGRGRVCQ
jgi:hypothetical protein